jgi:hypothetical protein
MAAFLQGTATRFKALGGYRDAFLVGGALVYGLGYLVWAYTAWQYGLGILPGIEFQYLVAGVVPLLIIIYGFIAYRFIHYVFAIVDARPSSRKLNILLAAACLLTILLCARAMPVMPHSSISEMILWLLLSVVVLTLSGILLALYVKFTTRWIAVLKRFDPKGIFEYGILELNNLAILLMFSYVFLKFYLLIYPALPQDLGGRRPRCAVMEFTGGRLTPQDTAQLIDAGNQPSPAAATSGAVMESRVLKVYFSNKDYILARPLFPAGIGEAAKPDRDRPLFEIPREDVHIIRWGSCDAKAATPPQPSAAKGSEHMHRLGTAPPAPDPGTAPPPPDPGTAPPPPPPPPSR